MQTQKKTTLFVEDEINWEQLKRIGLDAQTIRSSGPNAYTDFLNGRRTPLITTYDIPMGENARIPKLQGKYTLRRDENGQPRVYIETLESELVIPEKIGDHTLTEEDKQNLRQYGALGRTVEASTRLGKRKMIVGVDRELNKVVKAPSSRFLVPNRIGEVSLSGQQMKELKDGRIIDVQIGEEAAKVFLDAGRGALTAVKASVALTEGQTQSAARRKAPRNTLS